MSVASSGKLAERVETSDFTSVQRRIESLGEELQQTDAAALVVTEQISELPGEVQAPDLSSPVISIPVATRKADRFLSPILIDELRDPLGPHASSSGNRCSDKDFLPMSQMDYLELLDWTARQAKPGQRGTTPESLAPIFQRLSMSGETWSHLVNNFGRLFSTVAGQPRTIEGARSRHRHQRFRIPKETRELLATES